ncbi:DUF4032 domain-containing protein [bacterium]|nr:DUF4032 domain-containing protein [bacterium]
MSWYLSGAEIDLSFMVNTDLYKRFDEERRQILKNKWYLSEKVGRDIGFEAALMDWVVNHRENWVKSRNQKS